MSGQNRKQQNSSSGSHILSTLAAVGIGAIAAAGAFFVGKTLGEEEAEEKARAYHHLQNQQREREIQRQMMEMQKDEDDLKKDTSEDKVETERECVICMCEFDELKKRNVEIHTTPCGHIFCGRCINRTLRIKPECPTCKNPVEPGQTLRIFL